MGRTLQKLKVKGNDGVNRVIMYDCLLLLRPINECFMKNYKKKLAVVLSLCGLFIMIQSQSVAGLQSFFNDQDDGYKCGYKNDKGQIIVPAKYDYCYNFSEGLARISIYKPYIKPGEENSVYLSGYINEAGKLVIPIKYDTGPYHFGSFKEGMVPVYKNGKFGYMDKLGKVTIPYLYESAGDFNDGLAVVSKNNKYGAIDQKGKTVVPFKYNWLDDYSEGLATYGTGDISSPEETKIGFIDKAGNIVIKAKWGNAIRFSEGLAAVKSGNNYSDTGKWGVIDKSGKVIVSPKYDLAFIEAVGDGDIDGGEYENGTLDVYNVYYFTNGYEVSSIKRYTLNRQGKVVSQKTYKNWDEIGEERYPEIYKVLNELDTDPAQAIIQDN